MPGVARHIGIAQRDRPRLVDRMRRRPPSQHPDIGPLENKLPMLASLAKQREPLLGFMGQSAKHDKRIPDGQMRVGD